MIRVNPVAALSAIPPQPYLDRIDNGLRAGQRCVLNVNVDVEKRACSYRATAGHLGHLYAGEAAGLRVRWCSAYVKIMVMDAAIRNQTRFLEKQSLVLTGERYEESTHRQTYDAFEKYRTDLRDGREPRLNPRTGRHLATLVPLDKIKNADRAPRARLGALLVDTTGPT